jgi:O-antigen ligase
LKGNGSPARIIAIVLFGLVILGFFVFRRTAAQTVRPGVVLILVYFQLVLIIYGVGLSHLGSTLVEANKTRAIISLMATVGVALYAMTRVETVAQRTVLLGSLAIGLTFNCVVGLLQHSTHIDLHLMLEPPGFVINTTKEGDNIEAVVGERFGVKRAVGTSGHAIEYSVLAAVAVPLVIHFARYAGHRSVRVLATLATVIALLAMPAGVSRSGVIALIAALMIYIWSFKLRQLVVALAAGTAALLVEFIAFPGTAEALWKTIASSAQDESVLARVADYAKVSQSFHEHAMFGIGLGASPPAEYGFLDNQWLQMLVQGGIFGLAAIMLLSIGGVFGIAAALRCATNHRERDQAYAMAAVLIGILASSFTFDLFIYQQATLIFFLVFGLLWSNFTLSVPKRPLSS